MSYTTISACRSCSATPLRHVLDFGRTPLADRLLRADQLDDAEPMVPLTLARCEACTLVQITETVDPTVLFHEEYPYFTSVSPRLVRHFEAAAASIMRRRPVGSADLVVEVGSNDGCMLSNFRAEGARVLGVDPSGPPVDAAIAAGIPTVREFFGADVAARLVNEVGPASVIVANNVLAHVADLNGVVAGMATLLAPGGLISIEAPYLADLVEALEFDTIYHQHLCYFSVTALVPLFERHGLVLSDVERTDIHGGSLRLTVTEHGPIGSSVSALLEEERRAGFVDGAALDHFAAGVSGVRDRVRATLLAATASGERLAGYGAAAKATTMLSYCGLDSTVLAYVCDANEYKQGRVMPGSRLPIVAPTQLLEDRPDAVFVLAWNFADEIIRQNAAYAATGGRFIVPLGSAANLPD